uniref:ATPase H+ transporting accessory protein 1 like b n=1 Tax=Mastacembelus armatus TaxID=205130 RepID=A0A3Q3MKH5_9TELE
MTTCSTFTSTGPKRFVQGRMLVMRFGDVDDLRGLSIRLLSNTFYESSSQWWFSMNSVSLLYNTSEEAVFDASEVYAPASSSYHCSHVSNLRRYSALLLPSTNTARHWTITFTDFRIQAFNIRTGKFSPASGCTTFLTPAILMGLITSLILLLVLAYALHMVIHLKDIEHDDEHKADWKRLFISDKRFCFNICKYRFQQVN